ncbi:MAG: prolipoprotein diacylglyceryl transferase, partial [Xanthobacteraceae bacterium]
MPPLVLPFPEIDPVLIQIGPFALRWYALAYIAGILLGWLYARAIIQSKRLWGGPAPMTVADFDDFVLWVTLGVILGGRIGYVLFYKPDMLARPLEVLKLWEGGMSFHGGLIGVVLALMYVAKKHGLNWLRVHDYIACCVPPGIFLVRLANFVNGELWG